MLGGGPNSNSSDRGPSPSFGLPTSNPNSNINNNNNNPEPAPAAVRKPAGIYRVTRNQNGVLDITYQTRRGGPDMKLDLEGTTLKPGTYMEVTWTLPVEEYDQQPNDFVLGLVRYGAGSNSPGIVLKPVNAMDQRTA